MTRFKDFGTGATAEEAQPLSFKLYEEEFHCVPRMQGKVMLSIVEDASSDDPAASARTIGTFFKKVLKDESFARFDALLEDKDRVVSVETLSEIVAWLLESYSNRPEAQPEGSSTGQ
jgi:hypothetical protein